MPPAEPPPPSPLDAIGRTPLVALRRVRPEGSAEVLVKLESANPTGSYKDRMALAVIKGAEARGALRPGMTVVEFTGGSTGSSLAFVCAVKGYRFRVVTSDAFAREKVRTMEAFGAEVEVVPSEGGRITPDLFVRMRARVEAIRAEGGAYFTDQFHNPDIPPGYEPLGRELAEQAGRPVDAFCAAVGTAGMLAGAARPLRAAPPGVRVVALEPAGSPVLTEGRAGSHQVEGTGAGIVPPLLDPALYDEARSVDEGEARAMARRLAREAAFCAGTSTGLNVVAALRLARELGPGHVVATVAVDSGLKYLSGPLYDA